MALSFSSSFDVRTSAYLAEIIDRAFGHAVVEEEPH
jgi:hypothetical protein